MRRHLPFLALLFTLALIGVCSFVPIQSMWGLNHLQYLPLVYSVLLYIGIAVITLLWLGGSRFGFFERWIEPVDRLLFGKSRWSKICVAAFLCLIFYLFRLHTFLLGDGYLLLSVLGQDTTHVFKWTEPGSIWLIRLVQTALGGYTKETALLAFQILSFASGAVTVYNFLGIAQRLSYDARIRLLAVVTLIGSGSMLLFFGYVEHYPVVWAAIAVFANMALRYCDTGKGLSLVLLSFAVAVVLHLQVLFFAPAVFYLVARKLGRERMLFAERNLPRLPVLAVYLLAVVAGVWLSKLRINFEVIFLPILVGRPASVDYAMFSPKHLLDILSLLFLIIPGWLALLAAANGEKTDAPKAPARFLLLSVVGSLTFLVVIDPALGMARDWDLMSLSCLPLALYLTYRMRFIKERMSGYVLTSYGITVLVATVLFISVAERRTASEDRALDLLRLYGSKNNSGWVVLSDYYHERGEQDKVSLVAREMRSVFGDDTLIVRGYDYLEKQQYNQSFTLAERLVKKDPYRPEYLQLLGNACGKLERTEAAIDYYDKAIALRPYDPRLRNEYGQMLLKAARYREALKALNSARELDQSLTFVLEGIGLAYFNLGFLDSASQTAEKLFALNPQQPGGHLHKMVIAINQSDLGIARIHYEQYLLYGQGRSDYERIRSYYRYLTEKPNSPTGG